MDNKIFLVCPFSTIENFITSKFGTDVYFITSMGAIFNPKEHALINYLKEFIALEGITEFYVVQDIGCTFAARTIEKVNDFQTNADKALQKVISENGSYFQESHSLEEQKEKLAELNLLHQLRVIAESDTLGDFLAERGVRLKGLLTSKCADSIQEISFDYNYSF